MAIPADGRPSSNTPYSPKPTLTSLQQKVGKVAHNIPVLIETKSKQHEWQIAPQSSLPLHLRPGQ